MKKLHLLAVLFFSSFVFTKAISQNDISYKDDTVKLKGYYVPSALKAGKKKTPGVIVIHAWMGITAHEKSTADKLSKLGYNVLAADIYGENIRPANSKEASAQAGYYKKNYL